MEPAIPPREALHERHARYPGLTRPELALATAYTKIDLIQRLEATVLVDDSYLVGRFLQPYFPPSLAELADVGAHRLRHELIATRAVNELVDLAGSTFVFSFVRDRGVAAEDVVRAMGDSDRRALDSRTRRRAEAQRRNDHGRVGAERISRAGTRNQKRHGMGAQRARAGHVDRRGGDPLQARIRNAMRRVRDDARGGRARSLRAPLSRAPT